MIPYDDLVVALQTWRARQGLPVAQLSGAMTPPPATRREPSGPTKSAPPAPPPRAAAAPVMPPPLERPSEDSLDVEDAALLDEGHYENEGENFAMKFGSEAEIQPHEIEHDAESTNISGDPASRDTVGFGGLEGIHEQTEDLGDIGELGPPGKKPW